MRGIEFERSSTYAVVIAHGIPIPNGSDDIQWTLSRYVNGFVPSWIKVSIDYPGFGQAFLILVSEDNVWITIAPNITSLEIFRLHDFDSEHISIHLLLPLGDRRRMALNYSCAGINVDFVLNLIKLNSCEIDVVELDE